MIKEKKVMAKIKGLTVLIECSECNTDFKVGIGKYEIKEQKEKGYIDIDVSCPNCRKQVKQHLVLSELET